MKTNLFILFLFISVLGRSQSFQFTNYSLKDGLPQSQVYSIHEDNNGYIWMGTRGGGVARFDGQEFETFTTKDSLAGNYINAITSGGNMVWVATNSGVSFYKNKKWSSVLKGKVVQDIELINGTLWLIAEGELFTTNKTLDKLYKYLSIKGSLKKLEKGFKNQVWVCSQTKVYHIMPDSVASYRLDKSIECIEYQHPNELWVATHGQGLYQLNGQEWIEFGHLMEIEDEIIYNVFKDGNTLWINTLTKGVFQFNPLDSSFVNFKENNGLSNNHTRVTQKDSWGNIWIGTGGAGVSKYSGQTFEKWSKTNGLRGNYIYATYQDLNGSIWVGTSGGGVTIIDSNIRYLNSSNGFSSFKTKAIFQSRDSAIWLGTDGDGLSIILNDTILHFSTQNDLNSNWVKAFAEDAKGNVWVGTSGGGISKFTFKSDSTGYVILNYLRAQGDLISDRITDLVVDKNNRLWYATQAKGLGYISGKDFSTNTIPGLNGQNLRSLCVDSNHLFIAGTRGVNLISLNTDSLYVQNLEGNTELTSENIYSMQLDANGGLWVGTEKGLDHLVLDGNQVLELTHYDASNGFSGVETTTNGSMLDQEGNVWFGSIDGLFKFNSDGASKNMTPAKISWKEIKIGSETKEQIQEKHPRKEQWTLPYGNNRISFDFVGINQSAPKKVRYKWQLKGRDNHYSEPSQNHFVEYGSLPPGKYVFIASAENENGIWSKEPITFSFTVLTPIWMKTWFIAAVVATIVLLLFVFYRMRISRLKRKLKEREEKITMEKNLIELEQKALQLQMNPHFIFHTLNSIQELVASKEEKVARKYLTKFSKLMRQILDGSRVESIALSDEIKMLGNYLELERFSHENKFEFSLKIEGEDAEFIAIPTMVVQPFIENAIIHGALKAEENGRVDVTFETNENEVICRIIDNGPGFKKKENNGHKSAALAITEERLKHLTQSKNAISVSESSNGVTVQIALPILELE